MVLEEDECKESNGEKVETAEPKEEEEEDDEEEKESDFTPVTSPGKPTPNFNGKFSLSKFQDDDDEVIPIIPFNRQLSKISEVKEQRGHNDKNTDLDGNSSDSLEDFDAEMGFESPKTPRSAGIKIDFFASFGRKATADEITVPTRWRILSVLDAVDIVENEPTPLHESKGPLRNSMHADDPNEVWLEKLVSKYEQKLCRNFDSSFELKLASVEKNANATMVSNWLLNILDIIANKHGTEDDKMGISSVWNLIDFCFKSLKASNICLSNENEPDFDLAFRCVHHLLLLAGEYRAHEKVSDYDRWVVISQRCFPSKLDFFTLTHVFHFFYSSSNSHHFIAMCDCTQ